MGMPHIPIDTLTDILSWLPVKSLKRFSCVCKSWCSMLENPTFIAQHLKNSALKTNGGCLLLTGFDRRRLLDHDMFTFLDGKLGVSACLSVPIQAKYGVKFLGSCNGLLCLKRNLESDYLLWNPATKQHKQIPSAEPNNGEPDHSFYDAFVGFAFVAETNDYELVRVAYHCYSADQSMVALSQVYSTSMEIWREIDSPLPCYFHQSDGCYKPCRLSRQYWPPADVKGSLYWTAYKFVGESEVNVIVGFNMVEEVFCEQAMPELCRTKFLYRIQPVELKGSLGLIDYTPSGTIDVWVMNGSWTKQYRIAPLSSDFLGVKEIASDIRPVGYWKSGMVVVRCSYRNYFQPLYLCGSNNLPELLPPEKRPGHYFSEVCNYIESLVPLTTK
ncbi:hypothetical protein RJ640_018372 [Escallonia rubra]|uniref:F-box domain-containing protein n=2 Tax=Escallonia rubra TaxID=112253 RepID=A0AA88URB2_9ASTE|nr:hypothetical protein RJ640_018372 [Escallonia rubra]